MVALLFQSYVLAPNLRSRSVFQPLAGTAQIATATSCSARRASSTMSRGTSTLRLSTTGPIGPRTRSRRAHDGEEEATGGGREREREHGDLLLLGCPYANGCGSGCGILACRSVIIHSHSTSAPSSSINQQTSLDMIVYAQLLEVRLPW